MNTKHLLEYIVRPALKRIGKHSIAAEQLVIGTIMQESRGKYLKQHGNGPAVGIGQIEPATHTDIWQNYLAYRESLSSKLVDMLTVASVDKMTDAPPCDELIFNLNYSVAMIRVHYLRVRDRLPPADDINAMARYWKDHYNTQHGKGTVEEFIHNFPRDLYDSLD